MDAIPTRNMSFHSLRYTFRYVTFRMVLSGTGDASHVPALRVSTFAGVCPTATFRAWRYDNIVIKYIISFHEVWLVFHIAQHRLHVVWHGNINQCGLHCGIYHFTLLAHEAQYAHEKSIRAQS